ncbi:uncharacterized protein [Typha angustifolia]|uniref:uncharacterized protein n=1 Tax=Typha angustifolia TaxID=59011 RepID=UPI003C2BC9D7
MSIQGHLLEVTVVGCSKLRDTEWISRQDPFVSLDYATTKFRTRTCTDGGKNPSFQEKTVVPLVEGLREIAVSVWNSNTIVHDNFIGGGRIQLQKVLGQGYDDSSWPLQTKSGKYAGEVKLIMYYSNAAKQKPAKTAAPMSYAAPAAPAYSPAAYYAPQPYYNGPSKSIAAPPDPTYPASYPPAGYPTVEHVAYPPPMLQQTYPAPSYQPTQTYPPVTYPTQVYPPAPPPYSQPCYPPAAAPYPGIYPPPPY